MNNLPKERKCVMEEEDDIYGTLFNDDFGLIIDDEEEDASDNIDPFDDELELNEFNDDLNESF